MEGKGVFIRPVLRYDNHTRRVLRHPPFDQTSDFHHPYPPVRKPVPRSFARALLLFEWEIT